MYSSIKLTSAAMDAARGPWNSSRWLRIIASDVAEWFQHFEGDRADSLLEELAPRIASEGVWTVEDTSDAAFVWVPFILLLIPTGYLGLRF